MHIIINGWFWGLDTAGSGQYLHHLMAQLPALLTNGHNQLTLVIPKSAGADAARIDTETNRAFAEACPNNLTTLACALPPLPRQLAKLWWEQVTIPNVARQQDGDVLWVPYWAAPLWQPIPTVVTVHDLIPALLPQYRGGRLQRLYTSLVFRTAQRSKAIVAVSESGARDIVQHLGIDKTKVHTVLNGSNMPIVSLSKADYKRVRTTYSLPDRFFLYLGGFDVRKNVASLIRAYKQYIDKGGDSAIKFVLAGSLPKVDTDFFPDSRLVVAELGLEEHVHFCGFVAEEDKQALYHLSVGYLFPSHYEGFGMTVVEAMDAGTPVVTSEDTHISI